MCAYLKLSLYLCKIYWNRSNWNSWYKIWILNKKQLFFPWGKHCWLFPSVCNLYAVPWFTQPCLEHILYILGELILVTRKGEWGHEIASFPEFCTPGWYYETLFLNFPGSGLGVLWTPGLACFLWILGKQFCCWASLTHTFHLSTIIRISISWIYIEPHIQRGQNIFISLDVLVALRASGYLQM